MPYGSSEEVRALQIACALALLSPVGASAGTVEAVRLNDPVLGTQEDPLYAGMEKSMRPTYRLMEGISDGVYDFMRRHVVGNIFSEQFSRSLRPAPNKDSTPLFDQNLREKESRFLDRARAAYPRLNEGSGQAVEDQRRAWRGWAAGEQASVAADAMTDTLMQRYDLELFGESAGRYASKSRNWDPAFVTTVGVAGGTLVYLNGLHGSVALGKLKLGIDLSSGMRLQHALQGDGNAPGLGGVEVGLKGTPVTLSGEWGLASGHVRGERVALNYRARF